ncbi:hypothetical protein HPB52_003427 [Rhipicephalus sanguineus]|uniref:Uncharacterized protein n=1 Tax=Rhipicephalus sanguineus TaxID=34632 RepID=A0A9D4PJ35_RHISA|nr:hypothetical protein HPB52_003427 [Rhipicephalus sanguineus]
MRRRQGKFQRIHYHPVNEVYVCHRSHKCNQFPGETADTFYTMLKNMVKKCSYRLMVEGRHVCDSFVVGLLDSNLSDQLNRVSS